MQSRKALLYAYAWCLVAQDLHKNMERMLQQQARPETAESWQEPSFQVAGGSVGSQALMPRPVQAHRCRWVRVYPALAQMQMQLGGLLDMFGDHHAGDMS